MISRCLSMLPMFLFFVCLLIQCISLIQVEALMIEEYKDPGVELNGPRIMSVCYGLQGCVGVPSTNDLDDLNKRGCVVVNGTTNSPQLNIINLQCGTKGDTLLYTDGMPISFNYRLDPNSKVNLNSIQITLSNNSIVYPLCAQLIPANELNEGHTLLLIGRFGDGREGKVQPKFIQIVGDLFALNQTNVDIQYFNPNNTIVETDNKDYDYEDNLINLKGLIFNVSNNNDVIYNQATIHLIFAVLSRFSTVGESKGSIIFRQYPNDCDSTYGSGRTSHKIQLATNGGGTLDGLTPLRPFDLLNGPGRFDQDVFVIRFLNGTILTKEMGYIGIADLGQKDNGKGSYTSDRDNFYDLCLSITDEDALAIHSVTMPCKPNTLGAIVPPKGFPICLENSVYLPRMSYD